MIQWESLRLFIASNKGIDEEDFLEFYPQPVLIQQKKQGVPIKLLLKVDQATKGKVELDQLEKQVLPGFGEPTNTKDVFAFLPFNPDSETICIGKDPKMEICLNFPWISDKHARLGKNIMGLFTLEDLHSKEGVLINEVKMLAGAEYPILDFTQLIFGRVIKYFFLSPKGFFEYMKILTE